MKRVNVKNPSNYGRLAIANSSPAVTKGRKKTGLRDRRKRPNRHNPDVKVLFTQSLAAAAGAMLVTTAAGKLPLPTNPVMNIGAKAALSYALAYLAEKIDILKPYANSIGIGGASVAASDALKIAVPSLRTIFLTKEEQPVKVVTQSDAEGEPVAVADVFGWDEMGDVVTMNERYVGGLADVIEELGDIYNDNDQLDDLVTPSWTQPERRLPTRLQR
jgi:hypothetical protein